MHLDAPALKRFTRLFVGLFLLSCNQNPFDVDVSKITLNQQVQRFEDDLFRPDDPKDLLEKYPSFFPDFTVNIINIGSPNTPTSNYHITAFVNDPLIKEVKQDVKKHYADFSAHEKALKDSFKRYHYHFPEKYIPSIITFVSGFNYAIAVDSNYLGIGLDMFLGANYEAYKKLGIPQYKANSMTQEHLVSSSMLGWITTEFELNDNQPDLLTEMVHQGKLLYLLSALLPDQQEHIGIAYTPAQLKWSEENAEQVWFHFIDHDLLFSKSSKDITKFMGEAPFIKGFPEGSPGRIGHWIGWQMVKAYSKKNPRMPLKELMSLDATTILNESKYKP